MLISFPLGIDAKARLLDNMGVLPLRFVRSVLIMVTLTYNPVNPAQVFAFFPHPHQHLFFCPLDNSFLKRSDVALKKDLDTAFAKPANSLFGLPWQPKANESWTFKPPFCIICGFSFE